MANSRGDETANTNRLLQDRRAEAAIAVGNDVAVDASSLLSVPLQEAGGKDDLADGIGLGLAVLPGDDGGQVVLVLHDQVVPSPQDARALSAGARAPERQGDGGGADGLFGVLGRGFGTGSD